MCIFPKACSSLQLLPGAQAGILQLLGKMREASNLMAGGICLEQRHLQILHQGPLIAKALRALPLPAALGSDAQPLCSSAPSWVAS